MNLAETLQRIRAGAGVFALDDRGLIGVSGSERARWLDGMISADVGALDAVGSGAPALVLTHQGRLVADLHVLNCGDHYWLDVAASAAGAAIAHFERLIIADDVDITDLAASFDRIAVEGAQAREIVSGVLGGIDDLPVGGVVRRVFDGTEVSVADFGFTGLPALQLIAPVGSGSALARALEARGGVVADREALECLRVESGVPRWGNELDDSVLPAEARLERAISTTKGCYTGQEVVTRMRSRGRVSHLLVGLAFDILPEAGTELRVGERKVGEVTSALTSPSLGPIGLGYLKSDRAAGDEVFETAAGDPVRLRAIAWAP